jgi:hypothetical protein
MENNIYRSPEINHIMGALSKAQGSYKPLVANEDAPGGKFSNLQGILLAVRESLASNGLAFYQFIELLDEGSGAALLRTILGHESGQYISSTARVVRGKSDRQTGNIYEIHKRFHALMILGIAPSTNDPMAFDDNGEELAEQVLIDELRKPKNPNMQPVIETNYKTVNKDQYNELLIELEGFEEIAKDMLDVYKIETLADLPQEEYHKARAKILKLKRTHETYLNRR